MVPCGIDRSLINLLTVIDYEANIVDLFIYDHSGPFMAQIPKEVNILKELDSYWCYDCNWMLLIKKGMWRMFIARMKANIIAYFSNILKSSSSFVDDYSFDSFYASMSTKILPELRPGQVYDVAISYMPPHNIVLTKVTAQKKICWIHTDYSNVKVAFNRELPIWNSYDTIVAPTMSARDAFIKSFCGIDNKIKIFENISIPDAIRTSSLDPNFTLKMDDLDSATKICSVGSLSYAKGFDIAVEVCALILTKGIEVKWFVIGEGEERRKIEALIDAYDLEDTFILLGQQLNPYPYIRACDIYVQPSRYEAQALSIREAQILNKPVIIFDFYTAADQLHNEIDGLIIQSDAVIAAEEIIKVIGDRNLQLHLISNTRIRNYGTTEPKKKFEQLIS